MLLCLDIGCSSSIESERDIGTISTTGVHAGARSQQLANRGGSSGDPEVCDLQTTEGPRESTGDPEVGDLQTTESIRSEHEMNRTEGDRLKRSFLLCWVRLGWAGLGLAGLGWAGLGWGALGWVGGGG